MELKEIPIDRIKVSPHNVRKRIKDEDIEGLSKSIDEMGLLQPITVEPCDEEGVDFEAVIGQRRLIAMKKKGAEKIPAIIRSKMSEIDKTIASLTENIQKKKLPAKDKADACEYLMEKLKKRGEVAKVLGVSIGTVTKHLGLKHITSDEVLKITGRGSDKISEGSARKIGIYVEDEDKQLRIAKKMIEENLTGPETDRVFDVIRENPEETEGEIIRKAKEEKETLEIIIHLSGGYMEAFENAVESEKLDNPALAKRAVEEWLEESGYG